MKRVPQRQFGGWAATAKDQQRKIETLRARAGVPARRPNPRLANPIYGSRPTPTLPNPSVGIR